MNYRQSAILLALAVMPGWSLAAQQGDLSIDSVVSNTYEPKKLPAADERVQQLRLAKGFASIVSPRGSTIRASLPSPMTERST